MIKDPNETFTFGSTVVSNDEGQRIPDFYYELRDLNQPQSNKFKTGTVLSHEIRPDSV